MQELYPEIYGGGSSEREAIEYFEKWGWYATIHRMAKGKFWRFKEIEELNINEFHMFLAHDIDLQKMKTKLRQGKNTTAL